MPKTHFFDFLQFSQHFIEIFWYQNMKLSLREDLMIFIHLLSILSLDLKTYPIYSKIIIDLSLNLMSGSI
jgi:hypothetical protein